VRPSARENFLDLCRCISLRATCARRAVGCVLVDRHNHVIGTGYNGTAAGIDHCIDQPCPGAALPSGRGLEKCEAIHAEANALLQCKDVQSIVICYCTTAPCIHCVKLLMNTSCLNIVYAEDYPGWEVCANLWRRLPERQWIKA
jgi:dCMP deaminase